MLWAGEGHGAVILIMMTVVLHQPFMEEAVRFPTEDEKVEVKVWVEAHSFCCMTNLIGMAKATLIVNVSPRYTDMCNIWFFNG